MGLIGEAPARAALFSLDLPWPPSVNHVYESRGWGGGRRLSVAARTYRTMVDLRVRDARRGGELPEGQLNDRLAVVIEAHPPTRAVRDLDNLGKAILDAGTKARLWVDDGQIDDLRFVRRGVEKAGRIRLHVSVL